MKFLQNLSIRNKLIIASLIPLIALLYYLQLNLRQELNNKESAQRAIDDVSEIEAISRVVHEFQKERALALIFLDGKGTREKEQLINQREFTDKEIFGLNKILKDQNKYIENYKTIDNISSIRARTLSLSSEKEIDAFYSRTKILLLDEVSKIIRASQNQTLKNQFEEHLLLLHTKDCLAQLRTALSKAIIARKFEENEYGKFASIKGMYENNLQKFRKIASPELKDFFNKKYEGPFVQQAYNTIDSVFQNQSLANFRYDFNTWWDISTSGINSLKEVEDFSGEMIRGQADKELKITNANVISNTIIAILVITLIILLITSTIRGIVSSINKIKDAADRMVKGDDNLILDVDTKDEIGSLAHSFKEMIAVTKEFSEIADVFGKGDYSPSIKIRGEKDTLGLAFTNMKNNLLRLSTENESRSWLLTGNSELNNKMRGEKEAEELAQVVINQLCSYLNAQIGAIYLTDDDQLRLLGSYAFEFRKRNTSSFKLGEGLVGQAALEKKTIVFTEVPDDYIKINSGLGNTLAKSIIVFPLLYEGKVRGVIELGFANEFSDLHVQFLNTISESIAIAIASSNNRKSLKESLGQIQTQKAEMEKISMELSQQIGCLNNAAIVSIADADGNIIYVNDLFIQISKYSREELHGKNHRILKSGKQPDGLFTGMWKAISSGRIWSGEIMNKAKDGTFYWVDTTITPFKGADGRIEKYVAIRFDITKQKESLTQIQTQKAEMEKISMELSQQIGCLNNAAIVSIADADGNIIYVNDLFIQISKYSREELHGKNHRILKSGKQPDGLFTGMWKAISSGKVWNGEIMNKAKDGTFYWVDTTITPFKGSDGKIEKYVAIRFDITKQKEQAEKLKDLLEETQRQAEELESQQEELKQANDELQTKTQLLEKSEAELKAQQEELQQSNEELEEKANMLEEQKETLENAKMEIENKARELEVTGKYKSEFLANMSHELRTPLNSILILAQLLAENKSKVLGEKEIEFSKNIYNSGADLLNLINEILDLSKVESGKMELDIQEVPLKDISGEISAMFSEVAKNKVINFKIALEEKMMNTLLVTDKQRLEQILRNLLSNAFKFTGKNGEVTLAIEKSNTALAFKNKRLNPATDIIAFAVSDTGIGIPENKQGIIFEAFQQADGSTKRKYGGTGLGLSISRELANALGGEIHLKSEEGKGSTFTLYIPLKFDPSYIIPVNKQVEVKERQIKPDEGNKKIEKNQIQNADIADDRYSIRENDRVALIMEDDPEFSNILLGFVRERKYKGIIAHQGNTGISYARHYKPDAIMLDMKLPVMDGAEVLKQLKNDPDLRHIPVQIISGYDRRKEGMELGAFDYIRKPISTEDLRKAFDKIEDFVSKKLKKLLIVEDNESQNKAIRELIGNGDVKCFSAYSGNEAYTMLDSSDFDCIIVDLGLPDMSGFELLEKIKANDNVNKIPVIVYTGRDLKKNESSILNKLANTVVLKTVDSQERLLDETILFLHRVESKLPKEKQHIIRKLHKTDEVLRNKKILIVDDDIRNIYSLTNALEEEGLHCLTAENGKVALRTLKENPTIDLVLMDVMMPEMDGYEATAEIRKLNKFSKLPIIALTAKAMKGDREKCLATGMSDYIAKPVNVEQLLSLMRVWLYH